MESEDGEMIRTENEISLTKELRQQIEQFNNAERPIRICGQELHRQSMELSTPFRSRKIIPDRVKMKE